ncbi:hypothetical protein GF366_03890, partial [Candidatus Peregrinibacteria bacterium]|nr:hypothetical protein [Candidatus Peregrinibacteria bacterium]
MDEDRSPYAVPGTLGGALTLPGGGKPAYFPDSLVGVGMRDNKKGVLKISFRDNRGAMNPMYDTRRFLDRFRDIWDLRGGGHAPASSLRCNSEVLMDEQGRLRGAFEVLKEVVEKTVEAENAVQNEGIKKFVVSEGGGGTDYVGVPSLASE